MALRLHQEGELLAAGSMYRQLIADNPANADALHLLGVIEHQQHNHTTALDLIRSAIALDGRNPLYWNNLGEVLRALDRLPEARECYAAALALDQTFTDARDSLREIDAALTGRAAQPSARVRWESGIGHEIEFWEQWIATRGAKWSQDFAQRLDPERPLQEEIARYARRIPRPRVEILDVGAGPLTWLGRRMPGKTLHITAIDPLAQHYDGLLTRFGIDPPVRTQPGLAEELTQQFPPGSFDIVHARNALDHAIDPLRAIHQMLVVARSDGHVLLFHHENEGQREGYEGFHQWDFFLADGEFLMRRADGMELNVSQVLAAEADVSASSHNAYVTVAIRRRVPVAD